MCQSFEEVPNLFDMLTPANLQYVEGETSGSRDLVITVQMPRLRILHAR